jgi:LmbE family N-acetylglucosaminyl deacetylase
MSVYLVIAPHADDETLGCGGTISKLTEKGEMVYVAIMTNAFFGAPELFSKESIEIVRKEALDAHKILGVNKTLFYDLPAPLLEQYPQYKISKTISTVISELKPDTVFVPHRGDLHKDHEAIFNAALVATRPQNNCPVKRVFSYETLSETEWGHPFQDSIFVPNYFTTLSENNLQKKSEAMSAYKTQIKKYPHPRSIQAIESLAKIRGATVGVCAAEAFSVIRIIE